MLQNVPHQIVQSPARLGLPNPNSPSLQNPPSKFSSQTQSHPPPPPPQPSTQPAITDVSLSLLHLLPPVSRAQSLLARMASLASKLFEASPNKSHWLSAFRGTLPSFLSSQTQSLSDSNLSSTKEILAQFTTFQNQLYETVTELQQILDLQDARQKLAREIRSKDSAILAFANKLKEAEHVLDMLVDDYSDYRRPKRSKPSDSEDDSSSATSVSTQLKLSEILSYAHKISYTTFAPPDFGAGQGPLRGALPPAPQEEQMRASQLYSFADLDIGLPEKDKGKEMTVEPLIEPSMPQPRENDLLANLPANLFPPNFVIPSEWKRGMPVELPTDLPFLPPPGWKPGDPVVLPPLDALPAAPRVEEQQQPRPVAPSVLAKPLPEPIQVRHVQLDIEDDSSDYSSDEASSDSED